MTNLNFKYKLLSICIAIALLVCTLPLTTIAAVAAEEDEGLVLPSISGELTLGTQNVSVVGGSYVTYSFVPEESANYRFSSNSGYDPMLNITSGDSSYVAGSDDDDGYNFIVTAYLEAGKVYYLEFYEYSDEDNECEVTIEMLCKEHTPGGESSCLGTFCPTCGSYYGEAGEHVLTEFEINSTAHSGYCDYCGEYYSFIHEFNGDGECVCGYFVHECVFDKLEYSAVEHYLVCSLCGEQDPDGDVVDHSFDDNGVCECGKEYFADGIYIGAYLLIDGQYLDKSGNISESAPEGGYAYYNDGILTLNKFKFTNEDENPIYGAPAIYSETALTIVLVGRNSVSALLDDCIYVAFGGLTIKGDGTLEINSGDDYYTGDGIDVKKSDLIIESGEIYIRSGDSGIDVEGGNMLVNGGDIYIDAYDEGVDVSDNLVINGGTFNVSAPNDGFDISGNVTINGGNFRVYADDSGFEISGELEISGGIFEIESGKYGIDAYEKITLCGGIFEINALEGDYEMVSLEIVIEGECYDAEIITVDDSVESFMYIANADFGVGDYAGKIILKDEFIDVQYTYIYSGEEIELNVECVDGIYTLGVDFTIILPEGGIKDIGIYEAKVVGIGDYAGEYVKRIRVHETQKLTLNQETDIIVQDSSADVWRYLEFTPEYDGTYSFDIYCHASYYCVAILDSSFTYDVIYDCDEGDIITLELVGGVTYYIDVYADEGSFEGVAEISVICNDHFGGEATYTEQAECDRCGEHYGELLECDHMCHADGIRGFIWMIFDFVYDLIGIESECKCGEMC